MRASRFSQRGVTLTGLILSGVVVGLLAVLGMKVSPHVIEFYKVRQALKAMSMDGSLKGASVGEVRGAFDKRANTDYIDSIKGTDIDVTKEGNNLVLSISYSRQIPLFGPVSLVIDFETATNK
jgi:hypothetical protein